MNLKRLYQVDGDVRRRAQFVSLAMTQGAHAEPFDTIEELLMFGAGDGLLFVDDSRGGLEEALAEIDEAGRWFPVIGYREAATASRAVDALHMGAVDYFSWPIFPNALAARLEKVAERSANLALARRRSERAIRAVSSLTDRESEVLALIGLGHSNKSAAGLLGISPRTIEIHRANLMGKLGARSAAEAVLYAIEAGLVHREIADVALVSAQSRRAN